MKKAIFIILVLAGFYAKAQDSILLLDPVFLNNKDSSIAYTKDLNYTEIFRGEIINRYYGEHRSDKFGKWIYFSKDNFVKLIGYWYNDMKVGSWYYFDKTHELNKVEYYECNQLVKTIFAKSGKTKISSNISSSKVSNQDSISKFEVLSVGCSVPPEVFKPLYVCQHFNEKCSPVWNK